MTDWNLPPQKIEQTSFEIIDQEAGAHDWDETAWPIVRRMIHTSADFDYLANTRIHPQAIAAGVEAIIQGKAIFTDTSMAKAGISAARLAPFKVRVETLIADPRAAALAKQNGSTRASAAVDLALETISRGIYVIGNAPTALFRLIEHIREGRADPALVIGLPVGFVNAAESKAALAELDTPFITALGRKGGSNVAAAVVNALAIIAGKNTANQQKQG